jgi:hypothetical protein
MVPEYLRQVCKQQPPRLPVSRIQQFLSEAVSWLAFSRILDGYIVAFSLSFRTDVAVKGHPKADLYAGKDSKLPYLTGPEADLGSGVPVAG